MFSNLRKNNQIYILHKSSSPSVEVGTVVDIVGPKTKFPMTVPYTQQPEMVVDIVAKVGEQTVTYQSLPASQDIADSFAEGVVVTTSRDAMNSEVSSFRQQSVDAINNVPYHKGVVAGCDKILKTLNPEYAEKQAQAEEMNNLRAQVKEMSSNIAAIMSLLKGKQEPESL